MEIFGIILLTFFLGFVLLWSTLFVFITIPARKETKKMAENEKLLRDIGFYMPMIESLFDNQSAAEKILQEKLDNRPEVKDTISLNSDFVEAVQEMVKNNEEPVTTTGSSLLESLKMIFPKATTSTKNK